MFKTARLILILAMVLAGLYALLVTFGASFIANTTLKARTGMALTDVSDAGVAGTIVAQTRHLGVFGITTSIAIFFILFTAYSKAEKWAWWAMFFVGAIVWGYGIIIQLLEKDMTNLILHLICAALWAIGLFLPLKTFFPKKS